MDALDHGAAIGLNLDRDPVADGAQVGAIFFFLADLAGGFFLMRPRIWLVKSPSGVSTQKNPLCCLTTRPSSRFSVDSTDIGAYRAWANGR
jgi:hypothetical protein